MQSAQMAFSEAQARASALINQLAEPDSSATASVATQALGDPFDSNPDFEKLLEQGFARAALSVDHYVEKPFLDPYDCFEDSDPEHSFPFQERISRRGALEGLFESAPRINKSNRADGPDIEIEYLPNGGYRMSSRPKNQAGAKELDGLTS
ncbi:MAG: hypothetical protein KDN22_06375 [Verrucomicrobiae bacterium]|nr:hypothetical protein [Verrucomicrobiae bacterium]